MPESAEPERAFELVFVCTGNRFRSAMAAAMLRRDTADLPVAVRSFGTLDVGPIGVLPEALELAPGLGVDLSEHRARRLAGNDLSRADLVLGFERDHLVATVLDTGAARERTFTLPQLVRLLGDVEPAQARDPVARARGAVALAHERRLGENTPLVDELDDPLGGPPEGFREAASAIEALCGRLVRVLFGR